MNLEQIDTRTTAGKARVMQLSAEGRRVAMRANHNAHPMHVRNSSLYPWVDGSKINVAPLWDWVNSDYAIIAEPVGPVEVWVPVDGRNSIAGSAYYEAGSAADHAFAMTSPGIAVRYIRADLAGEGK